MDGDGLPNPIEYALGTNPSNADTDGDGLADRAETGSFVVTNSLSWLTLSAGAVDITAEFSNPDISLVNHELPHPITVQGETVTNVIVDLDGIIYLPRRGCCDYFHSQAGASLAYEICTNALVLVPYLADLYLTANAPVPKITLGEALVGTNPVFVVQYENVCPRSNESRLYETNTLSFQVVVPMDGTGNVHFLYQGIVGNYMDGQGAGIGVQALGGRWTHVYSYWDSDGLQGEGEPMRAFVWHGALSNGLDLSFDLGTGTDPLKSDTDDDGLEDGEELTIGTAPLLADTDGDGMNDGWENQHDGFDPLSTNAGNADPDDDGATNTQESEAGTAPDNPDTDGDGINDGTEINQGSDPNDRADTIPVKWVVVTGDLGEGQIKQTHETVTIPAGTMAFVGVFVFSEEYPTFTDYASEFNDRVVWLVEADGNERLDGSALVNNEDGAWDAAAGVGQSVHGFSPVVLKASAIYKASGASDLSVKVNIAAKNVSDDALPSTVLVGFFPLKVVQSNMSQGCGVANTTDSGTSYVREQIPTNGVAYITGATPEPPQLTAQFRGLPWWMNVNWSGALVSERPERFTLDNRTLLPQETFGEEEYDINDALDNEIVGGRCTLNIQVGNASTVAYPFSIRGKNPLDATARAYITAQVPANTAAYAWKISKHESKTGNATRFYNQFNPSQDTYKELPFKGNGANNWGWGLAQIDRGRNNANTGEIYDWHQNVDAMRAKLQEASDNTTRFIGYYSSSYSSLPNWTEPPATNINGQVVSAEMWSILTLYNGSGGIPEQNTPTSPRAFHSPVQFIPATGEWKFHTNSFNTNYVREVLSDSGLQEVE